MKNIEKNSITYLILLIITISICGIILYPLFDLILCNFITNSKFTYSIQNHIIDQMLFGVIFGIVSWVVDKKKK